MRMHADHRSGLPVWIAAAAAFLPTALAVVPAEADTEGQAVEILAVDPSLAPISVPCFPALCPQYAYGALPARFHPLGDGTFFVADDRVHGAEPWVSNGTAAGTKMLRDLCPGECSSYPLPVGSLGGEVFFWASTPGFGVELWASDGSAAGTRRLTDLCPGPCDAQVELTAWWSEEGSDDTSRLAAAELDGELFFGAFDAFGSALFASDGSAGGTRLVARACNAPCSEAPVALRRVGDHLAFFVGVSQPWWSDGSTAGTRRGPPQCPEGRLTENRQEILAFAGLAVYAGACGGPLGTRPSEHDLFAAAPYESPVSLARGTGLPLPAVHDGAVWAVFPYLQRPDELWRSDGSVEGSVLVTSFDLPPPQRLASRGGDLLLVTWDLESSPTGYRVDLWSLQGAAPPRRLNGGSLPLSRGAPNLVGERLLWWEAPGPVGQDADFFEWRLTAYGEGLDGADQRRRVQSFRAPAVGPDGAPKATLFPALATAGDRLLLSADGGDGQQLWALPVAALAPACGDDPSDLCLRDGRFRVRVRFFNQHAGGAAGRATPDEASRQLGGDTGYLWFFRPGNLELAVKVLDGRSVNGHFWVFAGGTTDLGYELEVLDVDGSRRRSYHHPPGDLCAVVDTGAFSAPQPAAARAPAVRAAAPFTPPPSPQCDYTAGPRACVGEDGRFQIEVDFRNQYASGAPGVGQPFPATRDTAAVRFFPNAGTELLVKVLDGRPVNGHFWVLWGGLTTLEYELRVRDLEADELRTYRNPPESRCGGADTAAF